MGLFGKKKDTKVAASVYPRKLTGMLVNLKKIQVELFGDQKEDEKNVEMNKLDEYGKAKYQLNELLTVIRNEHAQLEAYQGIDEKRRDFKSIKMQEENYKRLQMATSKWDQLKQHLAKDEQKVLFSYPRAIPSFLLEWIPCAEKIDTRISFRSKEAAAASG